MRFTFTGRTVLITGAANGIGRSLALGLAARKAKLVLIDRDSVALERLSAQLRALCADVLVIDSDLTEPGTIESLPGRLGTAGYLPDGIINNAGRGSMGLFEELEACEFDSIMEINFSVPVRMVRAFLPHLLHLGSGCIVNVSSILGIIGAPDQSPYVASKFALRGFSEALAMELKGRGIGVNIVYPGGIATAIETRASIARNADAGVARENMQRYAAGMSLSPDTAAEAILRGVEAGRKRILIGRDARAADRLQRLLPVGYLDILGRRLRRA